MTVRQRPHVLAPDALPTSRAPDAPDPDSFDASTLCGSAIYQEMDVHRIWRHRRRHRPIEQLTAPNGTPFWSVVRYDTCQQVLKDTTTFGSQRGTILASVGAVDSAGGRTISLTDPPEHTALRQVAVPLFKRSAVAAREAGIDATIGRLVGSCIARGKQDLVPTLRQLPMIATAPLVGLPEHQWEQILAGTLAAIAPHDPAVNPTRRAEAALTQQAHLELFAVFAQAIALRRANPGADLITALLARHPDGQLTEHEVAFNCYSFMLGANVTTSHIAARILTQIVRDPGLLQRVRAESDHLDQLIEEAARWRTPTRHLVRSVRRRVILEGKVLEPGDWICAWIASGNRDETVFSDPDVFNPGRSAQQHFGFGLGAHFCIGAPAAKTAIKSFTRQLLARSDVTLAGHATPLCSNWIDGVASMPVTVMER